MAAAAAACAYPALTSSTPASPASERYTARGQDAAWLVQISNDRIDYSGNNGETRISTRRPEPRTSFKGRRYETASLTVDVTNARCNDPTSGHGYEHQVMVIADCHTVRGCGGERRPHWDM